MYRWVRNLHLISGLIVSAVLLMYAVSGFAMAHRGRLSTAPEIESHRVAASVDASALAAAGGDPERRDLERRIRNELGLRGRLEHSRPSDGGGWTLIFRRPGTEVELSLPARGPAQLKTTRSGAADTLDRMHQFRGYSGEPLHLLWAAVVDLTSLALVLFAVSGVYMWYVVKRDRVGWILLGCSSAYVMGSILYLLWAP
jgi:hypothetical protein